jgi:hypothetical protein
MCDMPPTVKVDDKPYCTIHGGRSMTSTQTVPYREYAKVTDEVITLRVENHRQAELIAAQDEVVKAARQMIELGDIDPHQPESYRLVTALARLAAKALPDSQAEAIGIASDTRTTGSKSEP